MDDCDCACDCDGCGECCDSPDNALTCALCCNLCLSGTMVDAAETAEYAANKPKGEKQHQLKYSQNENGSVVISPVTLDENDKTQQSPVLTQPPASAVQTGHVDKHTTNSAVCNSDINLTEVDKSAGNNVDFQDLKN